MIHNPHTVFFLCVQVSQLEELLAVRHSVFVVGGPGAGKSQVNYCLTNTQTDSTKPLFYCLVGCFLGLGFLVIRRRGQQCVIWCCFSTDLKDSAQNLH